MPERRYPTEKDRVELIELYHLARVPGKERRYDRMIWAVDQFVKVHPDWTKVSAYKAMDDVLQHSEVNPVESTITKGNMIIPGKPQYKGYFIIATGYAIRQCKDILKKKANRVYSYSSPEYARKLDKVAFAFESSKLRDEAIEKLLTKMRKYYIIKYAKGYWYFTKKEDKE